MKTLRPHPITVRLALCAFATALVLSPAARAEKALTTEIPPEQIEGIPMPIKVPNLVPAPKKSPTPRKRNSSNYKSRVLSARESRFDRRN